MTTVWQESIVKRFVKEISLTKQFTDSFDDFTSNRVREIISLMKPIKGNFFSNEGIEEFVKIQIVGGTLKSPAMLEHDGTIRSFITPHECRIRGLSYSAPLYVDVHVERSKGKESIIPDVYIGRIPVMIFSSLCHLSDGKIRVKNGECHKDPGGYFIVNGNEKSLVGQKSSMHNRMITYLKNGVSACAVKSERNKRVHITTLKYKENSCIMCTFPRLVEEIPVMTLLMAMGVNLNEIRDNFTMEENACLEASFRNLPPSVVEARKRVRIREVYNVGLDDDLRLNNALENVLVPHMGVDMKPLFIIAMIQELLAVSTGKITPTDRDSVANQRVETPCTLLSTLFLHLMIKLCSDMRLLCQKSLPKLKRGIMDDKIRSWFSKSNTITDGFQYALATGNWNTTFVDRTQRTGVAQALQRLTYISMMSQLRRVSSSVEKTQKLPKPRYLHGSHWGRYCPAETPEGGPCGLETQLTVQSYISLERDPQAIREVIQQYLCDRTISNLRHVQVFINGIYEGSTEDHKRLVDTVLYARRSGQFPKDMSIIYKSWRNHIHISTTSGRICRPLLIVKDGKCVYETKKKADSMTFEQLLCEGVIEYLDCEEEDTTLVAFFVKDITDEHTHCEISNAMMNGLCAATIPFSDRNPGTRNTYQCAMAKQAQGVNTSNFQSRMDTTTNIMWYGQNPLASTKLANEYGAHDLPTGVNAIVAIMPFLSFNQEDSIIVNQSALDRGFARADTYKTIKESLTGRDRSIFKKPETKKRVANYSNLEADGLLRPGKKIERGDCVIGKVTANEDSSKMTHVPGTIDKVTMYQERNGDRAVKVRIRQTRVPIVGDKFSSRHGQKGTIGMLVTQEDMPWTIDGIVPDIIINPHAIPSRMTIGHLIECLTGKVASLQGAIGDASPFSGRKVEDIMQELHEAGFKRNGDEQLYSGFTGKPIQAKIFMGPTYYQRLKHMVDDKIHARGRGRKNALTHQPNDGRSNGGGLRVGEMEKDSFNAHGVPFVINERMCVSSDAHTMKIKGKNVTVPYAAKLLFEELQSMCIKVDLQVK